MENQILPKLAVSDPAQILIHPEHAEGNLKIPRVKNQKPSHTTLNILAILAIVFLLALLSGAYFLIPRTRTVIFARSTIETVGEVSDKTDEVDSSLQTLYQMLTNTNTQGTTEINSQVLGSQTSAHNDLWSSAEATFFAAKNALLKEGVVKGFSVPETDPNKAIRDQRKLAKDIETKQKEAESASNLISTLANEKVSTGAKDLQKEILLIKAKTDKYLSEAEKTSNYYVKISDASLDLYSLSTNITSTADIKNAISKLTALRAEFANLNEKTLPEEMSGLNQDVIGIFDLLLTFFNDVDSGKLNTQSALFNAYADFLLKAKAISTQTQTHELSFWQNNEALANYQDLAVEHTEIIKKATGVKSQNSYFLLNYLGVE